MSNPSTYSLVRTTDSTRRNVVTTRYAVIGTGHRCQRYFDAIGVTMPTSLTLVALL